MTEMKPWYQSKIIYLATAIVGVFGSSFISTWLGSQGVTPEQIEAIQQVQPGAVAAIQNMHDAESIRAGLGVLLGAAVFVARKWFTTKLLS